MKILFCSPTRLDRTLGAPKVIIELAEGLRHLGCSCDLIGPKDIINGLIDGRHDPVRFGAALREYLLRHAHEYDVVDYDHEYLPYERSEFPASCLMVARSVLLHYHFSEISIPHPRTPRSIASQLVRRILSKGQNQDNRHRADMTGKQADLFVTLNSQDKESLVRAGYEADRISVVGLGLHPERFAALGQANIEIPPGNRIAFVGTFDYRKGCLDLPKIADAVIRQISGARFRLIGTQGLFKTKEEVLSHFPARLRPRIEVIPRFLPEELPGMLADCAAGIFPSYIEGFGFGVLEMLAAGLPVVAYDAPGPPDILPAQYLTPRGDLAATAEALVQLLGDPNRLRQARIDARNIARNFTWARAARQTLDAYSAAINKKSGSNGAVGPAGTTEKQWEASLLR
jgi:glycosyltransferase involved in cell wall biosynthesis